MMVMAKQRLINKILLLFLFYLVLLSCSTQQKEKKDSLLECILDIYISEYTPEKSKKIFISEMAGWTDSTSIIRILSLNQRNANTNNTFYSKYQGIEIYFEYGYLFNKKIEFDYSNSDKLLSNNLEWKRTRGKVSEEIKKLTITEDFDEIQLFYHSDRKCIIGSPEMGQYNFKRLINLNCGFCD